MKKSTQKFTIILCLFSLMLTEIVGFTKSQAVFIKHSVGVFSEDILKEGDVIFQTSNSGQSLAIQRATGSKYSHVGIIFKENNQWMVYEAIQPVVKTPLKKFIDRGDDDFFTISRYTETNSLTASKIAEMKSYFKTLEGKNYDIYFEWSDKSWYCSELVWKLYNHAGIQISDYEKFGQFNLEDTIVKAIINERFKKGVNLDEIVITPKGIFESKKMKQIYTNYTK